jgi:thiamine-phosphate pyrophosphorylase
MRNPAQLRRWAIIINRMTPELTPAARRALIQALDWAALLAASAPEPRHVLLALLDEEQGRAAELLKAHGLDLPAVRTALAEREVVPLMQPAEALTVSEVSHRLHPLVYAARNLALELTGERTVASEHLLLAAFECDTSLQAVLAPLGLAIECLTADLQGPEGPSLRLDEPLQLADSVELIDSARILDANANRAREALRVVEEFCRFSLEDAFLSGELKRLRHDLAEALSGISPKLLLGARETQQDVGTRISTATEQERHSLPDVLSANCKRLQESLRALEEYGKLHGPDLGRAFEGLRYRAYTLERAVMLGFRARERLRDAVLYVLVGGSSCTASVEWTIKEAAAGGAQIFQLREKQLDDREWLRRAHAARRWTEQAGVLLIVNDRPDIARLVHADGVHLGQEDMAVKDARTILGADALIGVSTHNVEQLRQAILDGTDYVGIGPTFTTPTKHFEGLAGLDFVRQAAAETTLPAFAIGGISLENVHDVVLAGARRVAVSQVICSAEEPRHAAAALRRALQT